jgi:tetratricopeptide (TPR) repeat protein
MRCDNCGASIETDNRFCITCGHEVVQAKPAAGDKASGDYARVGELIYAAYKHKEAGEIEEAILACQGVLALSEDNSQAYALLGSLYELRGDVAAAVREYEKALRLDPANSDAGEGLKRLDSGTVLIHQATPPANETLRPYLPAVAAIATLCLVLLLGFKLLYVPAAKPATPTAPNNAPAQPYAQLQQPPQAPTGTQAQTGQQNPTTTPSAQADGSQTGTGIPPARLPQATSPTQKPTQSQPTSEPPVMVPVIEPIVKYTPPPTTTTSPGTSVTRPSTYAPPPSEDPEQRGLRMQQSGKYRDAVAAYKEALSRTSDPGRIHQQIAICYQRLGENALAVDSYNRAISAYKGQMSAGRDQSEVQRNIRACEAGIQVNRGQ